MSPIQSISAGDTVTTPVTHRVKESDQLNSDTEETGHHFLPCYSYITSRSKCCSLPCATWFTAEKVGNIWVQRKLHWNPQELSKWKVSGSMDWPLHVRIPTCWCGSSTGKYFGPPDVFYLYRWPLFHFGLWCLSACIWYNTFFFRLHFNISVSKWVKKLG